MPLDDVWTLATDLRDFGEHSAADDLELLAARLDEATKMRLELEIAERISHEDLQAKEP